MLNTGLSLVSFFIVTGIATVIQINGANDVSVKTEVTDKTDKELQEIPDEGWEFENNTIIDTRRILYGKKVAIGKRPYMVYLQLTKDSAKAHKYRGWLCGGVIVDKYYVLTSAACVEDADRFYIVSGTTQFVDSFDYKSDDCVSKHRRKVVWKCIPKNYKFDFQDSIKWSSNDIAIVKVDKPFKLGVLERDCEFATAAISYNNVSRDLEKAGTKGWIAGWGSGSNFREGVYRSQNVHEPGNAKHLQEAKVCVMDNEKCAKKWAQRFRSIITQYMICTKDVMKRLSEICDVSSEIFQRVLIGNSKNLHETKVCVMDNEQCAKKWAQRFRSIITQYMICTKDVMKRLSEICDKKYANCTEVETRRDDHSEQHQVDLGRHLRDPDDYTARRSNKQGGFCENDHGGPLIVKYQGKERVIGVISACKIDPKTHSCHGPFLYTSVFQNRQFISCSIHKDVEQSCRRVFRTGITHEEWTVKWDKLDDENDAKDKEDSDADSDEEMLRKKKKDQHVDKSSESSESESKEHSTKKAKKPKEEHKNTEKPNHKSKTKRHTKTKVDPKLQADDEVFYESSRDENVNEPNDE